MLNKDDSWNDFEIGMCCATCCVAFHCV
jgi:hypothetical protein